MCKHKYKGREVSRMVSRQCNYVCPSSLNLQKSLLIEYWQLCSVLCHVSGILGATQAEIEHHLEMGRKLLAAGQLAEALSHYHSAVGKMTHLHTLTFVFLLQEIIHFYTDAPSGKLKWHLTELWASQRETWRTTWPSTSERRSSWQWENPNRPCQTWPGPSSSSLISWLLVCAVPNVSIVRFPFPAAASFWFHLFAFLFSQARLQRGNILLKQGNTQEAREDFTQVVG